MNIQELEILLARGEAGEMLVQLLDELDGLRAERDHLKAELERQAADLAACERSEYSLEDQAQLLDLIREAILVKDWRTGILQFWNPGAEDLYGWSAAEAVGQRTSELLRTRFPCAQAEIAETLLRDGIWEGELTHTRRDGERLVVESRWTLKYSEAGEPEAIVETNIDVTARKQAESCRGHLAGIVEQAREAIVVTDTLGRIKLWNAAAERMFGYAGGEVVGRSVALILPESMEADWERAAQALAGARVPPYETERRRKDGELVPVMVSLSPLRDGNGTIIGLAGLLFDLSEEKRMREEKARYQAERIANLEQTERMKDQFLSVLSHELRTPINAIMGFGSILDDELAGPLSPQQHTYMEKILCNSDRLLRLVDDLLVLSRAIAGHLEIEARPMDFSDAVARSFEAIRPDAQDKQMALVEDLPPDLPQVLADPLRLYQVLSHLLENALKFTPAGGTIRLSAHPEGTFVRVTVADTGPGVPPEAAPRLFRKFTQLDMSATRSVGGAGMGLSLVKTLVEAHGGQVGVERAPEGGAAFWFTLPAAP